MSGSQQHQHPLCQAGLRLKPDLTEFCLVLYFILYWLYSSSWRINCGVLVNRISYKYQIQEQIPIVNCSRLPPRASVFLYAIISFSASTWKQFVNEGVRPGISEIPYLASHTPDVLQCSLWSIQLSWFLSIIDINIRKISRAQVSRNISPCGQFGETDLYLCNRLYSFSSLCYGVIC